MRAYIIRRLLLAIPTLLIVSIVIFGMLRLVPGDVILSLLEEGGRLSEEEIAFVRAELGLDKPFLVQYGVWMQGLLRGDLGNSLLTGHSVNALIGQFFQVSLELVLLANIIGLAIAIPLGVISAVYVDRWADYGSRLFSITGLSIPNFWIGTLAVVMPAIWWRVSPPIERISLFEDPLTHAFQFLVPAMIIGYGLTSITIRMLRTTMLEVLRQDYIRTARAKGLKEWVVLSRHGLKNAFIPVITLLGTQLGRQLGATVLIEVVFGLPGMGKLVVDAIFLRDYTVVQGCVMLFALIMVGMNLLVDLSYAWLDPRIRYT